MSGHRPWSEVRAEKQRRDRERGRESTRAHIPECSEDQSEAIERSHWEDPRPRYRVIAEPWYDHDPGDDGHDELACAAGYTLEVYRCNPDVRGMDHWRWIGATQTNTGGTFNLREVKEMVIDYAQALAHPHPSNPDPDRIEVYQKVIS